MRVAIRCLIIGVLMSPLSGLAQTAGTRNGEPVMLRVPPEAESAAVVTSGTDRPDKFRYSWADSDKAGGPAFEWFDISGLGTGTGLTGDENRVTFVLPFPFEFYGVTRSSVSISSKGYLSFGPRSRGHDDASPIPDVSEPNDLIAVFLDDLAQRSGQSYYYYDAPNARFIIQYSNWGRAVGSGTYDFQVQLHANGAIYFYYRSMIGKLDSASIGIENSTGADGLRIAHQTAYVHDHLAVKIGTDAVYVDDPVLFRFFTAGATVDTAFKVRNETSKAITVTAYEFDQRAFWLATSLPVTIAAGSTRTLTATIRPDGARLYASTCRLTYQSGGETKQVSGGVSAGLFLDDDSELAYNARGALAAYDACKAKDPNSAATQNNLGVLYRLLGEPLVAEQKFLAAVSKALNAKYGYSGVKMNIGVTRSDQGQASGADQYYNDALREVSANAGGSALVPQIYYNKAWEAYAANDLPAAITEANRTIDHKKANDCLKAKAYLLRGAVYHRQTNLTAARADFQQAITLSVDCSPIRRMASDALATVTSPKRRAVRH